jgi:glycosyltransferase involved in cell wall biosynthesis
LWIGRQEKIDLFIAFGTLYAFIESLPKSTLRKPMVTFLRGDFAFGMRMQGQRRLLLWMNQWIERVGIHFSDTIVSVNSTLRDEKKRAAGGRKGVRWKVLPNNIPPMPIPEKQSILEIQERYGIPKGAKVLVTAGVITRGKNLELLIRSIPRIGLENLFFLVVGDAATKADFQYHAFLKELVKDLELGNGVIFTGWLEKEELWKIFHGVDLFILPSKNEGMPNVMLEALGCDLPCMGSNIAGIEDILSYGELLFDPLDETMLANKLRRVFSDAQYCSQIERLCQGRKVAFIFDWKKKVFEMVTGAF